MYCNPSYCQEVANHQCVPTALFPYTFHYAIYAIHFIIYATFYQLALRLFTYFAAVHLTVPLCDLHPNLRN